MELNNKTAYEMTEEITLTDTELAAIQGGCGSPAPSACGDYGVGAPSYGAPSYGVPSYGAPSYGTSYPSYAPQYSSPFDTGSCGTSATTYTITTTTYGVAPVPSTCGVAPVPSTCGGY